MLDIDPAAVQAVRRTGVLVHPLDGGGIEDWEEQVCSVFNPGRLLQSALDTFSTPTP